MIEKITSNTIVIWPFLIFFFLLSSTGFAKQDPPFNLVIRWKNPSDTSSVDRFRNDDDLCCDFSVVLIKSDTSYTEICTRDGIVLGFIWGVVSPGFIRHITPKLFEAKYDLEMKKETTLVVGG